MDPIYVTGHRNPDTDSIVAAISYAALRNACGDQLSSALYLLNSMHASESKSFFFGKRSRSIRSASK